MICQKAAWAWNRERRKTVRTVKTGETQWKPTHQPDGRQRKKRHRVKSAGKLDLGPGNLKMKLRVMEGERLVETGETRWKRASNLLEDKKSEKKGWELSHWVDSKPVQGKEEEHDRSLRKRGLITGRERMEGVEGPDRLNYRGGKKQGERECVLYADDTTAKVTGEVWPELEVKLTRMLNPTLGLYTPSAVALVVLAQWPQATEIVYSRRCSKNVSRNSWASPASVPT